MAVQPSVDNLQHVEIGVSGPDGANRMFITTGVATISHYAGSNQTVKENYSVHVEPALTASQFRRAIASAAFGQLAFYDYNAAENDGMSWQIEDVDADFDDEAGKVELRFTIEITTTGTGNARVGDVSFTVTTLAKV